MFLWRNRKDINTFSFKKKNKKNLFGDVRRHGYETCILCRCIGSLLVKDGYEVTKDTFACLIIKIEDILCFGLL